jgi:hypothetical protein
MATLWRDIKASTFEVSVRAWVKLVTAVKEENPELLH